MNTENTEKKKRKSILLPILLVLMIPAAAFAAYVHIYKPRHILEKINVALLSLEGCWDWLTTWDNQQEDVEACKKISERGFLVTKYDGMGNSVTIRDITCDDELAGLIGKLTHLNSINMENVKITPVQANVMFGNLTRMASINLVGSTITSEMMPLFAKMPKLASFTLAGTQVTGEGLKAIHKNPGLRILNLSETPLGDDDMDSVAQFGQLDWLLLNNTKVTDAGVKKLEAMPRLRHLTIMKGNSVSSEALKSLQGKVDLLDAVD